MTKPTVTLIGEDGNVFNIVSIVTKALKRDGQPEKAKEFKEKAFDSASYDDVLALLHDYVTPE